MKSKKIRKLYAFIIVLFLICIAICTYFALYFIDIHKEDLGLAKINYVEKYSIDYNVMLNNGKYYNGSDTDNTFKIDSIDKLNTYYNFNMTFDKMVQGTYSYNVSAKLFINKKGTNDSIKIENISEGVDTNYNLDGNVLNLTKEFDVDIKNCLTKYNEYKKNSKQDVEGILIYDVVISYDLYNKSVDKSFKDSQTLSINIPLDSNSDSKITTTKDYETKDFIISDSNKEQKDPIYLVIVGEFVLAIILFVILILLLVIKINRLKTPYVALIEHIFTKYRDNIVRSRKLIDLSAKKVLFTLSFEDLLVIANKYDEIIYYNEIIEDKEAVFIVINKEAAYVYKVSLKELKEK